MRTKTELKTKLKYNYLGTQWIKYWDLQLRPFIVLQWHKHDEQPLEIHICIYISYVRHNIKLIAWI